MSTDQNHLERRAAQRFGYHVPVSVRAISPPGEGHGVIQNLSARGAFFYTDFVLSTGDAVELTLVMPSEITLAENMRVRCRGKVMRVVPPISGTTFEVAVHLQGYEFLPQAEATIDASRDYHRISGLHEH
jgi:PilZ domain-containing protein